MISTSLEIIDNNEMPPFLSSLHPANKHCMRPYWILESVLHQYLSGILLVFGKYLTSINIKYLSHIENTEGRYNQKVLS